MDLSDFIQNYMGNCVDKNKIENYIKNTQYFTMITEDLKKILNKEMEEEEVLLLKS